MTITIIGASTSRGKELKYRIFDIVNKMEDKITINLIEGVEEQELPILYVNNQYICKGRVPSSNALKKYIKKAA